MATLTRGTSFRRQGSSGMSWADTWTFTDDGVLVRRTKEENTQHFVGSQSRIHHSMDSTPEPSVLERSKSVGSVPASHHDSSHKSGFRVVRWLKKTFTKLRN